MKYLRISLVVLLAIVFIVGSTGCKAAATPAPTPAPTLTDVTSPAFTTTAANNTVTVTLTGGTFAAGPFTVTDFTFAGTDATALAAGTFTRTSDAVVTITGLTLAGGTDNTVTVLAATQATQAASVAGEASTQ
ncbi:MAG TPA: hypothetical protein VFB98_08720 [Candidatus Deferrimicrobium sp.]|nr:hypothetical protein [Candidatus Deferrimicrobium sp.]